MRWIFRFIPVPVIVTDRFIPKRFSAMSLGLLILLRPAERENEPLIDHELTHCRQVYRTAGIHALLYWFSQTYRADAEIEAYRVQAATYERLHGPAPINAYARMIATRYRLDISEDEAARRLQR